MCRGVSRGSCGVALTEKRYTNTIEYLYTFSDSLLSFVIVNLSEKLIYKVTVKVEVKIKIAIAVFFTVILTAFLCA